jgi:hypothetical protein
MYIKFIDETEIIFSDYNDFIDKIQIYENYNILILNFEKCNINTLPENICSKLFYCQEFNISSNNLVSLPENLRLPECINFNISDNKIKNLPFGLNLSKCLIFNIENNEITELPEDLNLIKSIKFFVSNNQLKSLPGHLSLPYCEDFIIAENNLEEIPELINLNNCKNFDISSNNIKLLPENLILDQCRDFLIGGNNITRLPKKLDLRNCIRFYIVLNKLEFFEENLVLPNCEIFAISNNCVKSLSLNLCDSLTKCIEFMIHFNLIEKLPDCINLKMCQNFNISYNFLKILPREVILPECKNFDIQKNLISELPLNLYLPLCETFAAQNNYISQIPKNLDLPMCRLINFFSNRINLISNNIKLDRVESIILAHNRLRELPDFLLKFNTLTYIDIEGNNNLWISPQIKRYIDIRHKLVEREIPFWETENNVHDSAVQECVRESIKNIMNRRDIIHYDIETLENIIIKNDRIMQDNKDILIEYIKDKTIHSTLYVTFSDILNSVFQIIDKDFNLETQNEIYKSLNLEIKDSLEMCFIGRITRLINSLNGYSNLIKIELNSADSVAMLVWQIKKELELVQEYNIEKHRNILINRMTEMGYDKKTIDEWSNNVEWLT